MTQITLIDYKEYPEDDWTKALCTVLIDEKHMVTYGKKVTKEGKKFWASANHSVKSGGNKVFVEGYLPDSGAMKKQILSFIERVEDQQVIKSAIPHTPPTSMKEVADVQEELPF